MCQKFVLDFVGNTEGKLLHSMEILEVFIVIGVRAVDEVARDVLQDQLDQIEELHMEDLSINHKLGVVVPHDLSDPFGDERGDLLPL